MIAVDNRYRNGPSLPYLPVDSLQACVQRAMQLWLIHRVESGDHRSKAELIQAFAEVIQISGATIMELGVENEKPDGDYRLADPSGRGFL